MGSPVVTEHHGVPAVAGVSGLLKEFLTRAEQIRQTSSVEPALPRADFLDAPTRLSAVLAAHPLPDPYGAHPAKQRQYAVVETAARDLFSNMIANKQMGPPDFVNVWDLLDVLSILGDDEQCDPCLMLWLVEELMDSLTIAGCQTVFDYLESRRERIMAHHFQPKKLTILRTSNELLRRLSRAEDITLCGRVFIFMFLSFPLGDKSAVNLRGEYHVENVTTYDESITDPASNRADDPVLSSAQELNGINADPKSRSASRVRKPPAPAVQHLEPDQLYPLFWSLQESFSQPKKLFDPAIFSRFRLGLEETLKGFRGIPIELGLRQARSTEDAKKGQKRKLNEREHQDMAGAFNPKYLTNRGLFKLEINDLSFRRHVLVQALIVIEFLLSLSTKARQKLDAERTVNKSVIYGDQVVNEDDIAWTLSMKRTIADYLKQGPDGPHFYRMVETVLSRDKNWVLWKMENCPPISKSPVSSEDFVNVKRTLLRLTNNKRLRPTPLGSMSLGFLVDQDGGDGIDAGLHRLQAEDRHQPPELEKFGGMIANDDFEIDRPSATPQAKVAAIESKASKSWRALRVASRTRLCALDRLDDPARIDAVFEAADVADADGQLHSGDAHATSTDEDTRPVVLIVPARDARPSLTDQLLAQARVRDVFARPVRHTTRAPTVDEVDGRDFHFVTTQTFNVMLDGDRFLEAGNLHDGVQYGTSHAAVDAVLENKRVPLLETDLVGARQFKGMAFSARYICVGPPQQRNGAIEFEYISTGLDSDVPNDPTQFAGVVEDFLFSRAPSAGDRHASPRDLSMTDVSTHQTAGAKSLY